MIVPAVHVNAHPGSPRRVVEDALVRTRELLTLFDPADDTVRVERTLRTERCMGEPPIEGEHLHNPRLLQLVGRDGLCADVKDTGLSLDITVALVGASRMFLRTIPFRTVEAPIVDRARCHEAIRYSIAVMETHLAGDAEGGIGAVRDHLHQVACHSLHAFKGAEAVAFAPNHWREAGGVVRHPEKRSDEVDASAFVGIGHAVRIDAYRISAPEDDLAAPPAVRIDGYNVGVDLGDDAVEMLRAVAAHERRMAA